MTVLAVVLMLGVVIALAVAIAWPLLQVSDEAGTADGSDPAATDARRAVDEDLQRTLQAIKEIEFDRAAGHLSDEDFAALDADERARAVELMRRRDSLAGGSGDTAG